MSRDLDRIYRCLASDVDKSWCGGAQARATTTTIMKFDVSRCRYNLSMSQGVDKIYRCLGVWGFIRSNAKIGQWVLWLPCRWVERENTLNACRLFWTASSVRTCMTKQLLASARLSQSRNLWERQQRGWHHVKQALNTVRVLGCNHLAHPCHWMFFPKLLPDKDSRDEVKNGQSLPI